MKRIYLLGFVSMFALTAGAQTALKIANPLKSKSLHAERKAGSNSNRQVANTITCNTFYVAGTTMDLNFTYTATNTDAEYVDSLAITFPAGITPTGLPNTSNPFPNTQDPGGGLEALNPAAGQVISWGANTNDQYGGIWSSTGITFTVNVIVAPGLTGNQTANYFASGDGYGTTPGDFSGSFVIYPAGAALVDLKTAFIQPLNLTMLTTCNYGMDTLVAKIMNVGTTTESNISVTCSVNGVAQPSTTIPGPLAPGDSTYAFFTPGYDFTGSSNNDLKAWVAQASDISAANDTATLSFYNNVSIALTSTTYTNGIETPADVNSLVIDGTAAPFTGLSTGTFHSGAQALFTTVATSNPAGTYDLMVTLPCMDVVNGETYRISYWRRTNTASSGNGMSGIFTGLAPDAASMTTALKPLSAITPLATWLHDSVDYTATATETRYFGIGGEGTVTSTSQMNVRIDDINITKVVSIGINEASKGEISVYPSPSTGILHVNVLNANTQVEVYNLLGSKIYAANQLNKGMNSIDLSGVAEGTYFVKIISENNVITKKVVINK